MRPCHPPKSNAGNIPRRSSLERSVPATIPRGHTDGRGTLAGPANPRLDGDGASTVSRQLHQEAEVQLAALEPPPGREPAPRRPNR
jgi:hypothetical protein